MFSLAMLNLVFGAFRLIGQTAFLAQRDEPDSQLIGDSRSKEKPSRVDPDDLIDLFAATVIDENIDGRAKQCSVIKNWGDVFENDSFFRKIRDIADCFAQPCYDILCHRAPMLAARGQRSITLGCV